MKISTFGSRYALSQVGRIDDGFEELGYTVNLDEPPDLIYSNDPGGYDEAINKWEVYKKKPKLILNVLDIPRFLPEISNILSDISPKLKSASAITCISSSVKQDIEDFLNYKAHIIYNPIKNVEFLPKEEKKFNFLCVGRVNAVNKRFNLAQRVVERFSEKENQFLICGPENPGFGHYCGLVPDDVLSVYYNRAEFVLCPSFFEGLGLPFIEAIVCGSIPIGCSDNPTSKEFLPEEFICEPNPRIIEDRIRAIKQNYKMYQRISLRYSPFYRQYFSGKSVARRILVLSQNL